MLNKCLSSSISKSDAVFLSLSLHFIRRFSQEISFDLVNKVSSRASFTNLVQKLCSIVKFDPKYCIKPKWRKINKTRSKCMFRFNCHVLDTRWKNYFTHEMLSQLEKLKCSHSVCLETTIWAVNSMQANEKLILVITNGWHEKKINNETFVCQIVKSKSKEQSMFVCCFECC